MNPALRFISANHWAIVPSVFDALLQIVERHDTGVRSSPDQIAKAQGLRASIFSDEATGGEPVMQVRGDTAVIPIRGVLARYSDQINGACQDQGRSAESIQADIASAMRNPQVARVILRIDSPGGSVAGTAETGAAIRALSKSGKRVVAYVDGLAASAAYWLASQADEIVASSDGSLVGSIGVIMATVDATKAQEKQGYKVSVHRSVDLKAPGTANESLTPAQAASIGKVLSDMHSLFASAVMSGRGISQAQVDAAATGEVFTATVAKGMGLVDRVASWEEVVSDQTRGARAMQTNDAEEIAASITLTTPQGKAKMSKSIEQAAALAEKHPEHAGMILALAAKDNTEEQIVAAINEKNIAAERAKVEAERIAAAQKLTDLEAKVKESDAALAAAEAKVIELTAQVAALTAHKDGSVGNKVQPDGDDAKQEKITQAQYDAMTPASRAKFFASGGVVA